MAHDDNRTLIPADAILPQRDIEDALVAAVAARVIGELRASGELWRLGQPSEALKARESINGEPCPGRPCAGNTTDQQEVDMLVRSTLEQMRPVAVCVSGGLAPWKLRKVVSEIEAHLDRSITLKSLAMVAGLSLKHFARAFRKSTGVSPHRWILLQRVARAENLLIESNEPIAVIAGMTGFADQSHMTASFRKLIGTTPGAIRRALTRSIPSGAHHHALGNPIFRLAESSGRIGS